MTSSTPMPAPGAPRPMVPGGRGRTTVLLVLGFVLIGVCGLLTTLAVLLSTGPVGFGIGLLFALVPVAPLVAYFTWLDRHEPEPWALLVFAFGWGAAVATFGSLVLNIASTLVLDAAGQDPEVFSIVVTAPVVEEALKGLGLGVILWIGRRSFDGIIDGVVYAGMVGVGFAFLENILYLGAALLESGGAGLITTFVVRGIFSPFAHPLFTAPIGIAIALAARRGGMRWFGVGLGYVLAVLLHAVWNGSAVASPVTFVLGFVLLQVPLFATYLGIALWARAREGRLIATHLEPYAQVGWLTPDELGMLGSLRARRAGLDAAGRVADGGRSASAMRRFQRTAVQLAFLRNRIVRGSAPPDARAREYDLLQQLTASRPALLGGPAR